MATTMQDRITFGRLPDISTDTILAHMSDSRLLKHMPLLTPDWDHTAVERFVAAKEEFWRRDGLGHWAILLDRDYVGWGGFQKEGDEWDFGLVLKPEHFGLGSPITRKAMRFARQIAGISSITFLLPPSRNNQGGLERRGADRIGYIEYSGKTFLKYRLEITDAQ